MNYKNSYFAFAGILVGIGLAWAVAVAAVNGNHRGLMNAMGMQVPTTVLLGDVDMDRDDMPMFAAMNDMMMGIYNKDGDAFDAAFLDEMIQHHQGAIRMAQAALRSAKHQEIVDFSNGIIDAQTREIDQMEAWRKAWYTNR